MNCPHCQIIINENAVVCPNCGAQKKSRYAAMMMQYQSSPIVLFMISLHVFGIYFFIWLLFLIITTTPAYNVIYKKIPIMWKEEWSCVVPHTLTVKGRGWAKASTFESEMSIISVERINYGMYNSIARLIPYVNKAMNESVNCDALIKQEMIDAKIKETIERDRKAGATVEIKNLKPSVYQKSIPRQRRCYFEDCPEANVTTIDYIISIIWLIFLSAILFPIAKFASNIWSNICGLKSQVWVR